MRYYNITTKKPTYKTTADDLLVLIRNKNNKHSSNVNNSKYKNNSNRYKNNKNMTNMC